MWILGREYLSFLLIRKMYKYADIVQLCNTNDIIIGFLDLVLSSLFLTFLLFISSSTKYRSIHGGHWAILNPPLFLKVSSLCVYTFFFIHLIVLLINIRPAKVRIILLKGRKGRGKGKRERKKTAHTSFFSGNDSSINPLVISFCRLYTRLLDLSS